MIKKIFATLCLLALILTSATALSQTSPAKQEPVKQEKVITKKEMITMISKIEDFGDKKKILEREVPELIDCLTDLLILEKIDSSRTALWALDESYKNHVPVYNYAIGSFSKEDQKKLHELMKLLEEYNKRNGDNG